ncbi:MAG: ATP-binding protein [Bacteroidota bacterium]
MDELLDHAPCGFVSFYDNGIINEVNQTLANLLGYAKQELIGQKVERLMTIAGRIFFQTHFFPLVKLQGKAEEVFLTLTSKDNDHIPALVSANRKIGKALPENHCIIVPVHQRQKYEQELLLAKKTAEDALNRNVHLLALTEELEKNKLALDWQVTRLSNINSDLVQFSNVISHDMQEPVRKIAVFADIVRNDPGQQLSEDALLALGHITTASRRMRSLVMGLQEFVSMETAANHVFTCDLNEIVADTLQRLTTETDVSPQVTAAALPSVEGQPSQIGLLFYHLLLNAFRFRREGLPPEIKIDCDIIQQNSFKATKDKYRYIDFARITVADNGRGFDNEYAAYIFQLFKKAHIDSPGIGFGLALCKKIVENHMGSISAHGKVNEGATITVLLPLKHEVV